MFDFKTWKYAKELKKTICKLTKTEYVCDDYLVSVYPQQLGVKKYFLFFTEHHVSSLKSTSQFGSRYYDPVRAVRDFVTWPWLHQCSYKQSLGDQSKARRFVSLCNGNFRTFTRSFDSRLSLKICIDNYR